MKKLTLTIAVAIMAASTMMACGNKNNSQPESDKAELCCKKDSNHRHHCCPDGKGQRPGGPRMDASKRVEMMSKQLELSETQKKQLLTYYTAQDSIRQANVPSKDSKAERPSMEKMKAEMEAQREAEKAELKSILNEEQYAKWLEIENNRPNPKFSQKN